MSAVRFLWGKETEVSCAFCTGKSSFAASRRLISETSLDMSVHGSLVVEGSFGEGLMSSGQ